MQGVVMMVSHQLATLFDCCGGYKCVLFVLHIADAAHERQDQSLRTSESEVTGTKSRADGQGP